VFGAARSAELAGMRDVAQRRYAELVAIARSGDGKRAEILQARAFLASR
jgi:hypothetical protein